LFHEIPTRRGLGYTTHWMTATSKQGKCNRYSNNWTSGMTDIKILYKKIAKYTIQYFRFDLQLHFFWSLFLTLLAIFWQPLICLGLVATVVKEALDLWSKGHWSWDDFWFGFVGWIIGVYAIVAII
tara:strand:+ start:18 stop:395 length:378 start_codon:yes stop_codon:yes gene_type:complete